MDDMKKTNCWRQAAIVLFLSCGGLSAAERTLTVISEGTVQSPAEKVEVNLHFTGYGWSVAKAQAKADETIKTFLNKISENKISISSMTLEEIKLKPSYQFNRDLKAQVAADFIVSRKVILELENVPAVAKLMDASLSIGSFSLESVVLTVKDKQALSGKAFENALELGKIKAESMAKAFGAKIGNVLSVEEIASEIQDASLIDDSEPTDIKPSVIKARSRIRILFSLQ